MKGKMGSTVRIIVFTYLVFELLLLAVQAEPGTHDNNFDRLLIVDPEGEGYFHTINEAVSHAQPGDTIFIKQGSYAEIITINKPIHLIGEEKDTTTINPISDTNKYAIRLGATGATLGNLGITNHAPGLYTTAIRITAPEITIDSCKIQSTPIGIALWSSFTTIANCTFEGCEDEGIVLLGSQRSPCHSNVITDCMFSNNCDGIELQHAPDNIIRNCVFDDNTHSGIDAIASENNNNIIVNCTIVNNRVHGIYLSASSNNSIVNCDFINNKEGNVVTTESSFNNIVFPNTSTKNQEQTVYQPPQSSFQQSNPIPEKDQNPPKNRQNVLENIPGFNMIVTIIKTILSTF
jgi:parallel beta-helix repeat protein